LFENKLPREIFLPRKQKVEAGKIYTEEDHKCYISFTVTKIIKMKGKKGYLSMY
jgi:hypothetical protein